jgi:hypothetical protein
MPVLNVTTDGIIEYGTFPSIEWREDKKCSNCTGSGYLRENNKAYFDEIVM